MQVGQPFNPFKLFTGIFIPEGLVRAKELSAGAKLTFGRLARYAGQNGRCYPAIETLAAEIGVGSRQTQRYITELEREKLIRRVSRFSNQDNGQTSNFFEFLWHPLFGEGVTDMTSPPVTDPSPKESHLEESHPKESHSGDLDYTATNRKKHDSRLHSAPRAVCKQYPRLQEALTDYMTIPGEERISPSPRLVVDVMNAAGGASEDDVLGCLRYLREERGLRPGTRNAPRHWAWFKTAVADYFTQQRERGFMAVPANPSTLSAEEFAAMTGALE
jgi:Helix-turn-helix domain